MSGTTNRAEGHRRIRVLTASVAALALAGTATVTGALTSASAAGPSRTGTSSASTGHATQRPGLASSAAGGTTHATSSGS